jgi:hypothetical protein
VRSAVSPQYAQLLHEFLQRRGSELSRRIAARSAQADRVPDSVK